MIFHVAVDEFLHSIHEHEELSIKRKTMSEAGEDTTEIDALIESLQKYVDMRGKGKTINFALIYGVGIDHLSELLDCSTTEAKKLKEIYFSKKP